MVTRPDQKAQIGRRLEEVRHPRSQAAWARKIGAVQQTWSNYEAGKIPDSWLLLAKLADEENVDLNELLSLNDR